VLFSGGVEPNIVKLNFSRLLSYNEFLMNSKRIDLKRLGGNPNSHTPAHESSAAVASSLPFNEIHYVN